MQPRSARAADEAGRSLGYGPAACRARAARAARPTPRRACATMAREEVAAPRRAGRPGNGAAAPGKDGIHAHQQGGARRLQGGNAASARHQGVLQGAARGRGPERQARPPQPPLPRRRHHGPDARRLRAPPARVHPARHRLLAGRGVQGHGGLPRHRAVLPRRRLGERRRGLLHRCLQRDGAAPGAARGVGGLPPRTRAPLPPGARGLLRGGPPAACGRAFGRRGRRPYRALRRQRRGATWPPWCRSWPATAGSSCPARRCCSIP